MYKVEQCNENKDKIFVLNNDSRRVCTISKLNYLSEDEAFKMAHKIASRLAH